jgi:hypothetical protein
MIIFSPDCSENPDIAINEGGIVKFFFLEMAD